MNCSDAADNGYVATQRMMICTSVCILWKMMSFNLGSFLLSAMLNHSTSSLSSDALLGSGAIGGGTIGFFAPFFLKNENCCDTRPRQWTKRLPRVAFCLLPLLADFIGDTIMSLAEESHSNLFFSSNRQASILGNVILTLAATIAIYYKYYAQQQNANQNENPERVNVTPL